MSEATQRRLAAIVSADVAEYSRLMGVDETGTLADLRKHRVEIIDPKIDEFGGRIVKTMGDGLLLEFPSVVNATHCALEIQTGMAARNAEVGDVQRIDFRIGINLGDVVIDGDDIHGDGVNIAARLQELAEPGGIAVSQRVYEDVRDRLDASFERMGARKLKNIDRQVHIYSWMPKSSGDRKRRQRPIRDPSNRPALAVLPFKNLSGDPEQEYFSDGLSEDLISALAQWRSFPIIARNSSFAYKGKPVKIKQLAQELDASYVLEGSVRKAGPRVRITAQLIDANRGHQLWAEKYDRDLDDIFELQDDIVQHIAALVAPELTRAEFGRSTKKRDDDLDAWDLFLRALPLLRERTAEGNTEARRLFLEAIDVHADYSDAYSGLAETYNMDNIMNLTDDRISTATQAMLAAQKAIRLDEASSWAHYVLSSAYQWLGRSDDALAEARISVSLNPNNAIALQSLGNKLDLAGDPSGIGYMEKAQRLDPSNASKHIQFAFLARPISISAITRPPKAWRAKQFEEATVSRQPTLF